MAIDLETLTQNAPFRVVIKHDDGSEVSIPRLSRQSAESFVEKRSRQIGAQSRFGLPTITSMEIREVAQ